MQSAKAETVLRKFDPENHKGNAFQAFQDFVDSYKYEYEAIAKDPPKELNNEQKAAWIEQNKRKLFLGRFASRNLQRAFEEVATEAEQSTITFTDLVTKLKAHFKTGSNTTLSNFEFHKLYQKEEESFDTFAIRVKHESRKCDFTCTDAACTVRDTLARDQIIIGVVSDEIRKYALKNEWNLDDLVKNGRQLEAASKGVAKIRETPINNDSPDNVSRIRKPGKYSTKKKHFFEKKNPSTICITCSSKSCKGGKKCPGTKVECFGCHKKGHYRGAQICKEKKKKPHESARRVESSDEEESTTSLESSQDSTEEESSDNEPKKSKRVSSSLKFVTKIGRLRVKRSIRKSTTSKRYEVDVVIKENHVKAYADTGADICIMSKKKAKEIGLEMHKTKMTIRPFGSKKVKCCGYNVTTVMFGDRVANVGIYVVNKDVETLLSGMVAEELGIITFNVNTVNSSISDLDENIIVDESVDPYKAKIIDKFPKVFTGRIGKLKDYKVKYYIDESIPSTAEPSRPISYHLQEKFEREIRNMEEDGVVEEHHGPAPWISNPILTPKPDGGMRVTLDMRHVNKAIKQTNIPIPRVEDIKARLAGCKVFSKIDFKSAFYQLELDEQSKTLTVFHAGCRLMRLNRLVQGSCPSSGELAKALAPLFQSIPQAHIIHDDLIIAAITQQEHDEVLDKVLQIIEDAGMTLNFSKCIFSKDQIPFWGFIVSKDGLKPDPKKIESLKLASRPKSKAELTSFLCMIQSNKDFIPMLANKTEHLRKRLKKNTKFTWDKHCKKEFEDLKTSFSEATLLHHFDIDSNTFIWVDAHRTGLSAILMQGDSQQDAKPIAFASRTTTSAEKRYPQLDLEALAIDFGLRRFRYYVVGGPTIQIITDHKPLVSIFANRRKGSIRTSRIKLRHQDVNYNVIWKKGCNNPADYLSRHAMNIKDLSHSIRDESNELEKTIWYLHYGPYIESIAMDKIIKETKRDATLRELKSCIEKGYIPKNDETLTPYRKVIHHLTISDKGLIMKDEKIILPKALQELAIKKAHQGAHPGMSGMKRRLRSHFWFPKMDKEIEKAVANCKDCLMFTNKRTKEPIIPFTSPESSWKNVNIDLFGPMPDQKHVLVVLDSASRFPAAKIVPNTSAKPVIKALDNIYTNYGQPTSHRTDNGPPFNSEEFTKYSQNNDIEHITSYPYHPQANPAETFMKPLGKTMKTAHYNRTDKEAALKHLLRSYRSTPHPATGEAPGTVMFRSGYKSDFPKRTITDEMAQEAFHHDQDQKLKHGHSINMSRHRRPSPFEIGDYVFLRNPKHTKFQPVFGPDTYKIISIDNGGAIIESNDSTSIYRRHLDDIKLAPKTNNDEITWYPTHIPPTPANVEIPNEIILLDETVHAEVAAPAGRPQRRTRPPPYLSDYVTDV